MTEENAGTHVADAQPGGGAGAGTAAELQGRLSTLEAQNSSLARELAEQRTIQAGLDRSAAQKDKQIEALTAQLSQYRTVSQGDAQALAEARAQAESLAQRVSELEGVQGEAEGLRTANTRLRLLMEKHPELAYLAANDALPAAESDEEFLKKLDNIAGTVGSAAAAQAQSMLSGSRPPAQPPAGQGDQDPQALWREGMQLIEAGKVDEGNKLIDRYWTLKR